MLDESTPSLQDSLCDFSTPTAAVPDELPGYEDWLDATQPAIDDAEIDRMYEEHMARLDAERELAEGKLPVLPPITAAVYQLNPAVWGKSA